MQLEKLNLLNGYVDKDYIKVFESNVKYIPSDEIMRMLLTDSNTEDWNPLIFAIFYQRLEILEFFCSNPLVYVRGCLVKPFLIDTFEEEPFEMDMDDEDGKFINEKSELFCLVMCIMLHNRDIFRFLLRKCCYIWNDVHLALLTNYVLEAQWIDGLKVLFTAASTH